LRKKGLSLEIERFRRGEDEEFRIASKKEMQYILQHIAEKGTRALLYYDSGNSFIVTTLLTASPDGIWLEIGPDQEANQHILQSTTGITIVSLHRGVKIQFSAKSVQLAPPSNDAFYMEAPPYILRIQRRNFFRLSVPLSIPLQCVIPVKPADPEKPDEPPVIRKVTIADISGGGLALSCDENEADLTFGRVFPDCQITLPGIGTITVTLSIRNSIDISLPNDMIGKRVGCQFLSMDLQTSSLLQRYISRLQSDELVHQRGQ